LSVWRRIIFFLLRTFCWHLCCVDFCLLECDFFPFFPSLFSLNSVWTENLGVDDNHVINRLLPICTMVQAHLLLPMRDPSIISCLYTSRPGAFFFNSQFREGRGWWWSSTRGMNQKFG
jgi:hypothetical protein